MEQPDRKLRAADQPTTEPARLRHADQLPPPEYRDRPESPCSPDWERVFEPRYLPPKGEYKKGVRYVAAAASTVNPETPMQALMETAPFQDPETSLEESGGLRERLADAIDALPPRQRWVFEARYFRGLSVREVGRELNLSKSFVDRIYQQAIAELQQSLRAVLTDLIEEQ